MLKLPLRIVVLCATLVACGSRSGLLMEQGPVGTGTPTPNEGDGAADNGGLPSKEECSTGGNVLWLDGDPNTLWFSGTETISNGAWLVTADNQVATYDTVAVTITVPGTDDWAFQFRGWNQEKYGLAQLQVGVEYTVSPGSDATAQMMIDAPEAAWCSPTGVLQLDDFSAQEGPVSNDPVSDLTVRFAVSCQTGPMTGTLRGCLHYAAGAMP